MDISAHLAAPLQLNKICRACLTEKTDMKPLYDARLDEMLKSFTTIQAQRDDNLPSLMCVQCVLRCSSAYTFKQLCEKSDCILRQFVKPEIQVPPCFKHRLPDLLSCSNENLREPVTLIDPKIEVDDSCEVDNYAELADDYIKTEFDGPAAPSVPGPASRTHVCTVCSKAFVYAATLKRHAYSHLDKEPPTCDHCDAIFADESSLEKHQIACKHTGKLSNFVSKLHACSMCDKEFTWATSLSQHMKYHTGHKLPTCGYCNKQFTTTASLKIHVRSHTGERPYRCDVCQAAFTTFATLEGHARVHTGEKPYSCPVCGKGFAQAGNVKVHIRTHTAFGLHKCETCGKGFITLQLLKAHQRGHTRGRAEKIHEKKQ